MVINLDKVQQEELSSLLLESNREVERLMNENINVKQSTVQDLSASRDRWEADKQKELTSIRKQLKSTEVNLYLHP